MVGLFQPKRVQVPGLLSDEGLAVALKNLSDTTKQGAKAAPPNTSAVDAANQITTEALKPSPTVKTAAPRVPGVELSAGAEAPTPADTRAPGTFGRPLTDFDVGKAIVQAGTFTPEQGAADRAERAAQAGAEAEVATGELAEKTDLLSADERAAIGLPPQTPEDMMRLSSSIAQEQDIVKEKQDRAKFIAEGPPTQQAEWLNMAQVSTRSAIQMGTSALRYPADIWDTLAAIEKGADEVKKSEASRWIDSVDKALTDMMPGDKTRSKDFTTKLAAGGGSMVGFMVTGWVGRAVGLPAWLTTGTLGAAVEGDSLYQEADTFNATATQKLISLFAGSALGVTEAIPIDRAFMRADVASGGAIRNLLVNTTSTSLEEFIQEASQSLGEDIIAKYGAAYDPNREISVDKALENGVIGAILGGAVGGATTLLPGGQEVDPVKMDEAQITEAVDAALAQESQRFASIIGNELDGEGEVAAPAQGAGGEAPAGGQAAATGPDPVRGDAVQQIVENQAAFHGTPHKFDKFSMEKIGTGEGAQAFGHGLYFAQAKGTAQYYRQALSDTAITVNGMPLTTSGLPRLAQNAIVNGRSKDAGLAWLDEQAQGAPASVRREIGEARAALEIADVTVSDGALYQVDIPDDAELLDWDAPVTQQPETVIRFIEATARAAPPDSQVSRLIGANGKLRPAITGDQFYNGLSTDIRKGRIAPPEGLTGDPAVSAMLLAAGVPGLRYLDAGSRGTTDNQTRNYVIFDDSRIKITDVESQQANLVTPDTMVAAADPTPNLDPLPGATGKPDPKAVQAVMAYAAASGLPITRQTRMYPTAPMTRGAQQVVIGDTTISYSVSDRVEISSVKTPKEQRGQGSARRAMAQVLAASDRAGLDVFLTPEPMDSATTKGRLRDFYASLGFADNKGRSRDFRSTSAMTRAARSTGPTPVEAELASLYTEMQHQPADPAVVATYQALVEEVSAQYAFAVAANGGDLPPYPDAPEYPADHPLAPVADQFWSLYQFFGTGLEGATDPENMWQAYARVFSASARPAFTTETRGPQGWSAVNGTEAPRKIGLMRSLAWEYNLDVEQVERIVAPEIARQLDTPVEMPRDPLFAEAVANVPGAEITPDGLLIDLVRFQKPEQEGATSVRTGVFYLPVGSSNARHYKTGGQPGQWYGGPRKVEGKTLIRKPLFVKGATGGKAPEVAYDTIKGKGASDKLTTAARSAATAPRDIREEVVDQFLTENGADPSMAREIMQNSQVGNQLVYALKENVIAHAVREAGYDAVVGYSKGKAGPFVSEVFDVREIDYPTPGEPATLHPDFRISVDRMTGTATVRQPYLAEPTRPTKGIPTPSPDPGNQEDVRLSQISRSFVTLLKLTARHGRLAARDSSVMGEYNRRTAAIRLRTWTDLSTLVHEGGHALNDSMAAPLNAFVQANITQINDIAHKFYAGDLSKATGETVRREGFAEFFRVYTLNPRFARNRWPQLVDAFEQTLRANDPQILDGLGSISAQFDAWLQLPSKQLIRNMIVDGRRESGIQAAVKELKDQGFKTWMHEHARRATSAMLNKYVAVADLEAQLLNLGEQNRGAPLELQRSESPTAILRLARNSGSRAQVQITDGVIGYRSTQSVSRGLREALMTALGIPPDTTPGSLDENLMKDFDAYLVARRAFDEFRRFDAGEIERPPIGAQKGDVMRTIKEYEQNQPQFIPAAQIVHEYGMAMWRKRYDAGLMDKDTYEEGLQRQFYAPLQRDVSDKQGTGADSIGFGSSVLTKGPRFRGSDRDIISPMTVLMQMTFALEKQIAENDAKRALAVLADRAGQAGALVERIPASQLIGQSFSVQQVAQRLTADAGLTAADASDLMTILAGSVDKGDLMTLFRSEQAGTQGENVIFFWENGKVAAIRLNDSSLAADVVNTMNAVGRENMDVLLEGVAATSTVFRTAITSWPDFLIVNYIRDQMSAWILGGTGYVPFTTGIQGISDEIRQKQWAKSYNAAGGTLGGMTVAALHRTRVDRDIRALRAKGYTANVFGDADGGWRNVPGAIKGLGRLTALTETGTRLGLYRGAYNRAIRDGLSEYDASVEAAYIATDYIDFGLNGSKMLHVRRLVPFLNAQLQGLYKMYRTLGGDEVARRKGLGFALSAYFKNINNLPLSRLEQQQLRTGRAAWLKMMALGLIGAAIWALFRDDPDYQEAGEYLRTTGWVIPTGDGKVFYIPKPFELAIVSNAVERGLEFATGDSTAIDRFKRGLAMTLVPPTAPPAIQSAVEVAANFDFFTGREIVPSHMQALAPQLQYDNYTSSIAKWIGGATGQSPLVVDHILSGLGASAYRDISTMLNAADPTRPMPDETEAPILRRFVRDVRRGSASAQDFWAQASNTNGKLEQSKATYKQYMEMGNQPAANRFLSTLNADERAYAILMTDFKPEEKRLNPFYRARQVTSIVSGMRRENASELGLGDTTREPVEGEGPLTFQMSRGLRTQVDDILSELARREVRNTLIATGQPGWQDKEVLPLEPTLDMLLAVSPDTYDEYQRRRVKAKVYDAQSVYDYWPEVRDRLNSDGPDAILSDAVAVAGVVF